MVSKFRRENKHNQLDDDSKILKLRNMQKSLVGICECAVENSIEKSTKLFKIEEIANGKNHF